MSITPYAKEVCSLLDQLALSRAFVQSELDRFLAWDSHFLNALNIREDEIETLASSEVLRFEDGIEFDEGFRLITCSACPLARSKPSVNGHAVKMPTGPVFVILDVGAPAGQVCRRGLALDAGEEGTKIYPFVHDWLSPRLMAAAFLAESLAARVDAAQPEAIEEAKQIRQLLRDVFDRLHLLFAPPWSR